MNIISPPPTPSSKLINDQKPSCYYERLNQPLSLPFRRCLCLQGSCLKATQKTNQLPVTFVPVARVTGKCRKEITKISICGLTLPQPRPKEWLKSLGVWIQVKAGKPWPGLWFSIKSFCFSQIFSKFSRLPQPGEQPLKHSCLLEIYVMQALYLILNCQID